jgi:hypothetical protein
MPESGDVSCLRIKTSDRFAPIAYFGTTSTIVGGIAACERPCQVTAPMRWRIGHARCTVIIAVSGASATLMHKRLHFVEIVSIGAILRVVFTPWIVVTTHQIGGATREIASGSPLAPPQILETRRFGASRMKRMRVSKGRADADLKSMTQRARSCPRWRCSSREHVTFGL